MAPTFFLKQFGLNQVSSQEISHDQPVKEPDKIKIEKSPKISPLRFLIDDLDSFIKPSVKELSAILRVTKFWVRIKPVNSKPILKRLALSSIPADAEPIFHEPKCLDCHEDDVGCDHCELSHACDRPHLTGNELLVAVAHPNALGQHAVGTFYREGDTIYQWDGTDDIAIFLPLTNLDPALHYRFVY